MFLGYRPQDKWDTHPDNSELEVHPSNEQVFSVSAFTENFQAYLQHFERFLIYLRNPYQNNRQVSIITEKT